jgi:glucose/arabinose dehydrogenase
MNKFSTGFVAALIAFAFLTIACKSNPMSEPTPPTTATDIKLTTSTIVDNREVIWGMDFLPNGHLLFTEKRGKMYQYANGKTEEITGLPGDIFTNGQGGLLDLKVHPVYANNGWIYISYAASNPGGGAVLKLSRFKLNGTAISNLETIFTTTTPNTWYNHYGSRIVFDEAGLLYLSVGEGGTTSYGSANSDNKNAQDVKSDWGKIHRMTDDGKIPADNPVLPGNTAASTVYSYGHRNPQGLAYDPIRKLVWENEHGPMGGDELNLIQKGKNYGWPFVSYGKNYDGVAVSDQPTGNGFTNPIHYWVPSIATSGMTVITSDQFKAWKGKLLSGSLKFNYVSLVTLKNDNSLQTDEKILEGIGRVRNVKQGPDGNIYVSVEGPGRIIKVTAN